jgi:hypothetical protein
MRADSPYHDVVKERKKKKTGNNSKPRAPSNMKKIKECIKEVFEEAGNPVSFYCS